MPCYIYAGKYRDAQEYFCRRPCNDTLLQTAVFADILPASGRFPLNFTYPLVKYFDGPNDGLVGEESFRWGQNYQFLTVSGKRGISHGDMIDLNRENIKGFDVREFYVQVVAGLKKMGF